MKTTKKLEINNTINVFTLYISQLNYKEKYISFALKPNNYDYKIFSFYYFRVIYFKKNETKYYYIDSYLGNLCKPEYNIITQNYYCNFILKKDYDESKTKFVISSTNHNEYYNICISKVNANKIVDKDHTEFVYRYSDIVNDNDYYIFQFEFSNSEIKNIIGAFSNRVENIYPQIYSAQMFFIDGFNKTYNYQINNNFSLIYQYIDGSFGSFYYPGLNDTLRAGKNYIGRPLSIRIDENIKRTNNYAPNEFCYFYQLQYNNKIKGIEEVKLGEPISLIMNESQFPLYFYLKLKTNEDMIILVNIRLKTNIDSELEDNIEIKGYLLNQEDINRIINGEYIQLKNPIEGYYSNGFDIGYIKLIGKFNENNNYLLIEIQKKENPKLNSQIIIDVVPKEYNNNPFGLQINRYIIETFDNINNNKARECNKYHINVRQISNNNQVFIELHSQNDDIFIDFDKAPNFSLEPIPGFKRYRIKNITDHNIYFNVNNPNFNNTDYMIRYYYTEYEEEYVYYLDNNYELNEISSDNDYVSINVTFLNIDMKSGQNRDQSPSRKGIYFLITGILYKQNEPLDICVNTSNIEARKGKYFTNAINHNFNEGVAGKWNLTFENIPRNNNDIYNLQLQVNTIILNDLLIEEFQIYNVTIDLRNIELNNNKIIILVTAIVVGILVIVAIFLIIKYLRLRKSNNDLEKEIKSIEFSNDVETNVLFKEKPISKKEKDYETTFI